jgi:hypothetical protein
MPRAGAMRACLFVLAAVLAGSPGPGAAPQASTQKLPPRLTDADFWALVTDVSEPGGFFRITDNYTSNENEVGRMFELLKQRRVTGGVYLGVGPEQNFSYIAATQPEVAFIIDIRRQAVMQHLMFKAMFELARDRADFIALLFAKPRPSGLESSTPIQKMWEAFFAVPTDLALAARTRERVIAHLTKTKKFTLTADESLQLDSVLAAFAQLGPGITTRGSGGGGGGNTVTFADLTGWSFDTTGQPQSFLSTEDHFRRVKALHDRNLIVPVSGDFGGPKTLRAIGAWIAARGATVNAFYVSNVEQYLFQDRKNAAFFANVAALPLGDASVFIRPYSMRRHGVAPSLCVIPSFLKAVDAGRVPSNNEALSCAG